MPLTTPPDTIIYFVIDAGCNRKRMSGCSQQQEKFVVVLFLVESGGCAHRFASGDIY